MEIAINSEQAVVTLENNLKCYTKYKDKVLGDCTHRITTGA